MNTILKTNKLSFSLTDEESLPLKMDTKQWYLVSGILLSAGYTEKNMIGGVGPQNK